MSLIINGEAVDDLAIREEMRVLRPHLQEAMAGEDPLNIEIRLREWSKENVIERVLLRQEARKQPLDAGCVTPPADEQLVENLVTRLAASVPPPKPRQILDFYKKHRDRFDSDEQLRVRHIVKNVEEGADEAGALAAIEEAQRELAGGADFAALADRVSDCPGNGGDLGYFSRGDMVAEFETVVFAMAPGEVSRPFRTPFGYHIAMLVERRPAGVRRFEEVRAEIEAELHRERRQEALEKYLDGLRAAADIREVRQARS